MWILNSSLIILGSILISFFTNTKIKLPRVKYFAIMFFLILALVGINYISILKENISIPVINSIIFLYLGCFTLYLEKNNLMGSKKRIRKGVFLPYLILFLIGFVGYFSILFIPNIKAINNYDSLKLYYPFCFSLLQTTWIFVSMFLNKNKKIHIFISFIILLTTIVSYYCFDDEMLTIGASISLLFIYNGVEGNINYYDRNLINFSENTFNLAYSTKKIKRNEILMFIKIDDKDVNKNVSLSKILGKNLFKFKKNLFGCFMKKGDFDTFLKNQNKLVNFKLNNSNISLDYHIYFIDKIFYDTMEFELSDIISYLVSKKENETNSNVYKMKIDVDAEEIKKNKTILEIIKDAVNNDGFEMFYQPIYSTHDEKFTSAEALIRIKNTRDLDFISPEIFIPLAEQHGYAERIGNIVFEKVCECFQKNHLAQIGIKYVELNVSGLHIVKETIASDFEKMIKKYQLSPENINIEITETAEITNKSQIDKNLRNLRKLGFKFSMDDFGSGYSNMMNIVENNYELIKIDKSIVWGALKENWKSETSKILLNTCIDLGHRLNRKIVAEGVENEKMVEFLTEAGVEYLQGYHYSKPLSEKNFVKFIKQKNILDTWQN